MDAIKLYFLAALSKEFRVKDLWPFISNGLKPRQAI